MLVETAPGSNGERILRRSLPFAVAGLVGITAGAAFVEPWSAVAIGAIAAPIMMASLLLIERVLKIDDPVGAISVHGVTGLWGLLAVSIFSNGNNGVEGLVVGEGN